jgi:hypothetical protein
MNLFSQVAACKGISFYTQAGGYFFSCQAPILGVQYPYYEKKGGNEQ